MIVLAEVLPLKRRWQSEKLSIRTRDGGKMGSVRAADQPILRRGAHRRRAEIREIVGEEVSFTQKEISGFIREFLETNKLETDGGADI